MTTAAAAVLGPTRDRIAAAAPPPSWVERLGVSEFRGYARLDLHTGPGPVVLTGANGAGKTNLLEALSLLAPGRGLRGARLGELARRGGDGRWAVSARLCTPGGAVAVGTGLDPQGAGERRVVRIDGQGARGQAALAETCSVLWLTPAMDRLFSDAPTARRRFLDRLVAGLEPGHGRELAAFERALRERARLLAERADGRWIDAVEETLAGHAVAVAAARREAVARIAGALAETRAPWPEARLALAGEVEGWLDEMPAVDAEQRLRARLGAGRRADAEAGRAGCGPHRSDLAVTHLESGLPAAQCSTGEQKALLISIVLANARLHAARRGTTPLVLLDEVAAHIDRVRRAALFEALAALGAQAWLSGTDAQLFEGLRGRAQFFVLADGRARAAAGAARW